MSLSDSQQTWFVYIVCCADNSLYTGITTDVDKRIQQHNSSNSGAKYTRSRRPVELVYVERADSRSFASRREYHLKKLSSRQKRILIQSVSHR